MLESTSDVFGSGEAVAALAWWVDAGVDTLVADSPVDWLAPAPPALDLAPAEEPAPAPPVARTPAPVPTADLPDLSAVASLDALRAVAGAIRPDPVFADGVVDSGVMVVGQEAAADDARTGKPFSGPAGALLDRMLAAIGRDRGSVYITNLHLWRLAGRTADPATAAIATAILRRHIELARPRALLLMGDQPMLALLGGAQGIAKRRGTWEQLVIGEQTIDALPTFNPAYLLRRPVDKGLAWRDLLAFRARINT